MNLIGPIYTGAAAGGAGAATATGTTSHPVEGYVVAVYVEYLETPPAGTTDVTIKTRGTAPAAPTQTILAIANAATSGWFYPQVPIHVAGTGAVVADQYSAPAVNDFIQAVIAQANDGDGLNVWLLLD